MKKTLADMFCLVIVSFLFFSCAKKDKVYDSYAKFAANLSIQPTEDCHQYCTLLKEEFRYLVYVGEKIYCYWDEKQAEYKVDFKQKAVEFENLITDNTSETQYFMLLVKWAGLFRDGHVNAMLRSDTSELELYNFNIRFEMLAPGTDHEKLIVSKPGLVLKTGTVVTRIQGKDWTEYAGEAEKFASGSTLQMRRKETGRNIFRLLLEKEGAKAIKVEGRYLDKDVSEVVSRNVVLSDGAKEPEPPEETGIESIQTAILDNNIGYLRIDAFRGSRMPKLFEQAMDRLSHTSGLILDVRKNGGGDLSGNTILSRLISAPIYRFHQRTVFSDILKALRPSILLDYLYTGGNFSDIKGRKIKPVDDPSKRYIMPVMVLTSANCFSACDTFVSAIKENKLGQIVGEATGGGTGNPQTLVLPLSEHSFRYSVVQGFTAVSKTLLEGAGTQPDVVLEPGLEEKVNGKDLQLEKAVQMLSSSITVGSSMVSLPQNLLIVKTEPIMQAFEVERDREIRKSGD